MSQKFVLYKLGIQYVISSLLMPYISNFLVKRLHTAQISLTMEYNSFQENYLRICLSPSNTAFLDNLYSMFYSYFVLHK